ncbi:MAG: DUF3048 domain-containing protein [Christensenellales bacterium]
MKRFMMIAMSLCMAALLIGCSTGDAVPVQTPTQEMTPVPTPELSATLQVVVSTPTPAAENRSYTTGLPFDGEYKPVLVVIENSPAARPQTGLQQADIVYEIPVESSITRFVCVFSDHVPSEVMPVRSGRVPFLYIQNEWSAVFMHFGGAGSENKQGKEPYNYYGHALYDEIKYDVDGLSGKWDKYYHRVDTKGAPHNVMGNPLEAQKLYDYNPEPITWLFNETVQYEGKSVNLISLEMCSNLSNYVTYTYDEANDVYLRSMSGKPFIAYETGKQVSVKNIIVQHSTYTSAAGVYKLWKLTGSGDAEFYIGGQCIEGRWERKSVKDDTVFYDDKGEQIVLKPGNTWIHIDPEK